MQSITQNACSGLRAQAARQVALTKTLFHGACPANPAAEEVDEPRRGA